MGMGDGTDISRIATLTSMQMVLTGLKRAASQDGEPSDIILFSVLSGRQTEAQTMSLSGFPKHSGKTQRGAMTVRCIN